MKCEDFIRVAKRPPEQITTHEKIMLIYHFKICDDCSRVIRKWYTQQDAPPKPVKIIRITVDESHCLEPKS